MNAAKIIAGALVLVIDRRVELLKALCLPVALYAAVDLFPQTTLPTAAAAGIAGLFLQTRIAVTTHRLILLPPGTVPPWGLRGWIRSESLFLLQVMVTGLCVMPVALLALGGPAGAAIAFVAASVIVSRVALVFPAAALDRHATVAWSWQATLDHRGVALTIVAVFPVLGSVPLILLSLVPYASIPASLLASVLMVVAITALSLLYREIEQRKQGEIDASPPDA